MRAFAGGGRRAPQGLAVSLALRGCRTETAHYVRDLERLSRAGATAAGEGGYLARHPRHVPPAAGGRGVTQPRR